MYVLEPMTRLTSTELALVPVDGVILFYLDPEVGVSKPHSVTSSGTEHRCVLRLTEISEIVMGGLSKLRLTTSRSISLETKISSA